MARNSNQSVDFDELWSFDFPGTVFELYVGVEIDTESVAVEILAWKVEHSKLQRSKNKALVT